MPEIELRTLELSTLAIPFTERFRHAAAERTETSSLWVTATTAGGVVGVGESCPRPYVTGETLDTARGFFAGAEADVRATVSSLSTLDAWARRHADAIDANPAAWCAVELAVLDALARTANVTIEAALGLPALIGPFRYTAVVGDGDPESVARQVDRYRQMGFSDFKVKLSGDGARDAAKLAPLAHDPAVRVRVDANNLWADAATAIAGLAALPVTLFAVEEPVTSGQFDAMRAVAAALDVPIVVDESVATVAAMANLVAPAAHWIVNVRVSKMGGLTRALAVVGAARAAGVGVVVGAQVGETSLLTRAALTVAAAAGPSLVAQEGAFGTLLLTEDVCSPPLMFGRGGLLRVEDHPRLMAAGFGIAAAP